MHSPHLHIITQNKSYKPITQISSWSLTHLNKLILTTIITRRDSPCVKKVQKGLTTSHTTKSNFKANWI